MNWNRHFSKESEVKWPINDSPAEAVVKTVTYKLRADYGDDWNGLRFLDVGCGGGATLEWLSRRGINAYGIDSSEVAIKYASQRVCNVSCESATKLSFLDEYFDGVTEACVLQHLNKEDRKAAYSEINRVLKPGGIFVGYCLTQDDDIFWLNESKQLEDDPGTIILSSGPKGHLQNIGLTHFFTSHELTDLLPNFDVECLSTTYTVPKDEATRRGMESAYTNSFYVVYGVKKCR